ncbi:hypothetical protein S40288_05516 [Stachybotrys chartarum IBT 40288]|nr:hypothetical protein S40288_05516 [Stachybotrys chartarum IBT 40288]
MAYIRIQPQARPDTYPEDTPGLDFATQPHPSGLAVAKTSNNMQVIGVDSTWSQQHNAVLEEYPASTSSDFVWPVPSIFSAQHGPSPTMPGELLDSLDVYSTQMGVVDDNGGLVLFDNNTATANVWHEFNPATSNNNNIIDTVCEELHHAAHGHDAGSFGNTPNSMSYGEVFGARNSGHDLQMQMISLGPNLADSHNTLRATHFIQDSGRLGVLQAGSGAMIEKSWPTFGMLGSTSPCSGSDEPWIGRSLQNVEPPQSTETPTRVEAAKRNRHPRDEWGEMEEHIRRLYIEENHTAKEVHFELCAIHGFETSLSTLTKKLQGLGSKERTHSRKALPKHSSCMKAGGDTEVFKIITETERKVMIEQRLEERIRLEEKKLQKRLWQVQHGNKRGQKKRHRRQTSTRLNIGPFLVTVYVDQEKLFHSIDGFIKGLFAAGRKSWTAEGQRFTPPSDSLDTTKSWQVLVDQVSSISLLVEQQLYHHVNYMLVEVLKRLKNIALKCDPNFLVNFWTICHVLTRILVGGRKSQNVWVGWFLQHLKEILAPDFSKHPLMGIVGSLLRIWASSPSDLRPTLGLGHWKTIHTLSEMIGKNHEIILKMGAFCTKSWKSKFSASDAMGELLHKPLLMAGGGDIGTERTAQLALDHLFAVSKGKYNKPEVVHEAVELLRWTADIIREKERRNALEHDSVTRAFVFSTELVATYHLETWKQPMQRQNKQQNCELSYQCMNEAIEILRYGDKDCRIRAASFSKRLATWIQGHQQKAGDRTKKVAVEEQRRRISAEKERKREIISKIDKEQITGSRQGRRLKGKPRDTPRDRLVMARSLLLASLHT